MDSEKQEQVTMTEEHARTITRALREYEAEVQADPDYADDERAEHIERIEDARAAVLAVYPSRNANVVARLQAEGLDPNSMTAREVADAFPDGLDRPRASTGRYGRPTLAQLDERSADPLNTATGQGRR